MVHRSPPQPEPPPRPFYALILAIEGLTLLVPQETNNVTKIFVDPPKMKNVSGHVQANHIDLMIATVRQNRTGPSVSATPGPGTDYQVFD